jgi:hypothetical protein
MRLIPAAHYQSWLPLLGLFRLHRKERLPVKDIRPVEAG